MFTCEDYKNCEWTKNFELKHFDSKKNQYTYLTKVINLLYKRLPKEFLEILDNRFKFGKYVVKLNHNNNEEIESVIRYMINKTKDEVIKYENNKIKKLNDYDFEITKFSDYQKNLILNSNGNKVTNYEVDLQLLKQIPPIEETTYTIYRLTKYDKINGQYYVTLENLNTNNYEIYHDEKPMKNVDEIFQSKIDEYIKSKESPYGEHEEEIDIDIKNVTSVLNCENSNSSNPLDKDIF